MCKQDDQPVIHGVSDVKRAVFSAEAPGISTIDEDIILALTEGLPESFSTFIVTLDNVIMRLLNEEVQQMPASASMNVSNQTP